MSEFFGKMEKLCSIKVFQNFDNGSRAVIRGLIQNFDYGSRAMVHGLIQNFDNGSRAMVHGLVLNFGNGSRAVVDGFLNPTLPDFVFFEITQF